VKANDLSIKSILAPHPRVAAFTFYQNIYKHLSLSITCKATKVFYNLKLSGVRDKTVGIHVVLK
jgi:hypothetical protein